MDQMPKRLHKRRSLDFPSIVQEGQHPRGFTAQVPQGTSKGSDAHSGWNRDFHFEFPEVERTGVWNNANRTGE